MKRMQCDVLVVGGGGAGLMSAFSAARKGARVLVVNKGKVQRSGATIMAPGAISAVDDRWKEKGDSREAHFEDTLRGGCFLNDQEMVRILCERSPELVLELERMGALFQRKADGTSYMLRTDGGHSHARSPFLEDRTGREMLKALSSALAQLHVPFQENVLVTRLAKEDGRIAGAVGIDTETAEPVIFESRAVVLATGGGGSVYENTDNSLDLTGDGYALALEVGVPLRDMEFVQFYPAGFLFPPSLRGMLAGLLYYCRLYNAAGERFMERYDPERLEMSTRDRVSRAIMQEVEEGRGTPHGGVYMDMTYHEPGYIAKMAPALHATYRNMGVDPEKDRVEIAPTAHFFMGGMAVDRHWSSCLPGLFGSGEVCGGMHGANRLSQNALAEILVSGRVSGEEAARYALGVSTGRIHPEEGAAEGQKIRDMLAVREGDSPLAIRKEIQSIMWTHGGVHRTADSLKKALREILLLSRRPVVISSRDCRMNREILEALEIPGMLKTSEAILRSALAREESRGAHFRRDYPETGDGRFLVNFHIREGRNGMEVSRKSVELPYASPEAK